MIMHILELILTSVISDKQTLNFDLKLIRVFPSHWWDANMKMLLRIHIHVIIFLLFNRSCCIISFVFSMHMLLWLRRHLSSLCVWPFVIHLLIYILKTSLYIDHVQKKIIKQFIISIENIHKHLIYILLNDVIIGIHFNHLMSKWINQSYWYLVDNWLLF